MVALITFIGSYELVVSGAVSIGFRMCCLLFYGTDKLY